MPLTKFLCSTGAVRALGMGGEPAYNLISGAVVSSLAVESMGSIGVNSLTLTQL